MSKKSKKISNNGTKKPKIDLKIAPLLSKIKLPEKVKVEKPKVKEETLEQEINETEAEHFSQFIPSQSSSNVVPIIRPASSPQSQATEIPTEVSAGEKAQREHDRNQMTSGVSPSDPSLARLYDVGKSLGGNAVRRYEPGEVPSLPTINQSTSQQSNFSRGVGFENPDLAGFKHDDAEPRYYAGTKVQGSEGRRRHPWQSKGDDF